ncbi:MAG: hypothetical protein M3P39_04890 [Actinomycetota bacterium]|nr:hypothetical protein [Actinomycetota bacterium]
MANTDQGTAVVADLRLAARHGLDRGAPDAAVPLLRRALDEPPSSGLLHEAGVARSTWR